MREESYSFIWQPWVLMKTFLVTVLALAGACNVALLATVFTINSMNNVFG
jgi:hypothetical protein